MVKMRVRATSSCELVESDSDVGGYSGDEISDYQSNDECGTGSDSNVEFVNLDKHMKGKEYVNHAFGNIVLEHGLFLEV